MCQRNKKLKNSIKQHFNSEAKAPVPFPGRGPPQGRCSNLPAWPGSLRGASREASPVRQGPGPGGPFRPHFPHGPGLASFCPPKQNKGRSLRNKCFRIPLEQTNHFNFSGKNKDSTENS